MFRTIILCLLMLSGIGISVRPLFAQSLADVAKKEEERRKTIHEPAKVYTNKDLGAVPPASPPPVATPATTAEAAKDGDKAKTAKDGAAKDCHSQG